MGFLLLMCGAWVCDRVMRVVGVFRVVRASGERASAAYDGTREMYAGERPCGIEGGFWEELWSALVGTWCAQEMMLSVRAIWMCGLVAVVSNEPLRVGSLLVKVNPVVRGRKVALHGPVRGK